MSSNIVKANELKTLIHKMDEIKEIGAMFIYLDIQERLKLGFALA